MKITAETQLSDLNIRYLRRVLEDCFLWLPEGLASQKMPVTVGCLCRQTGLGVDDTLRRLRELMKQLKGIEVSWTEALQLEPSVTSFLWIDREKTIPHSFKQELANRKFCIQSIGEISNFQTYLETKQGHPHCSPTDKNYCRLIVCSSQPEEAWGGALYLRQEAVHSAVALIQGV